MLNWHAKKQFVRSIQLQKPEPHLPCVPSCCSNRIIDFTLSRSLGKVSSASKMSAETDLRHFLLFLSLNQAIRCPVSRKARSFSKCRSCKILEMDRRIETEKKDRIECQIFQARFPSFFTFRFRSIFLSLAGFADTLTVSCRLRSLTLLHPSHIHTIVLSFLWPFSTLYREALFFSRRFIRLFFYTVFGAASTSFLFGVPASSRVLHFSPNNKWKMSARRVLQTAAEAPSDFCSYIYKMHYCVAQAKSSTRNIPPANVSSISPITDFRNEHICWSVFYRLRFAGRGFAQHAVSYILPNKIFKNSRWHLIRHVTLHFSLIKITITQRCIDLSARRPCLIWYITRCRFTRILRRLPHARFSSYDSLSSRSARGSSV